MRLAFGDCAFDSDRRLLLRAGVPVHLTPKGFRLLELLLAARPRALSRDEIVLQLWPDAYVSAGSLANLAAEVRTATGDDARRPRFVRTVARFGYAFCGEAAELPDAGLVVRARPPYRVVSSYGEVALGPGEWAIGRAPTCDVWLDSGTVSRQHARLRITDDEAVLEDLGSKNGTSVRGERLRAPLALRDGDVIQFGSVTAFFRIASPLSSTDTFTLEPKR